MSFRFDPRGGAVIVRARLWGPNGRGALTLALDTGATRSVVSVAMLVLLGYDPAMSPDRVQMTTGSGVEFAPRVTVDKIAALGQDRVNFPLFVLARGSTGIFLPDFV